MDKILQLTNQYWQVVATKRFWTNWKLKAVECQIFNQVLHCSIAFQKFPFVKQIDSSTKCIVKLILIIISLKFSMRRKRKELHSGMEKRELSLNLCLRMRNKTLGQTSISVIWMRPWIKFLLIKNPHGPSQIGSRKVGVNSRLKYQAPIIMI